MIEDSNAVGQRNSAKQIAESTVRKARRRGTILGWATAVLWAAVAAGHVVFYLVLYIKFFPVVEKIIHDAYETEGGRPVPYETVSYVLGYFQWFAMTSAYVWAGLIAAAAACTILYVMASRRATLHQLHAGLAEISDQLRALSARQDAS
ncbi:MAG: hypothetical protein JW809_06730 [Pirellulales bacterium]|nr:hypothetical protein [Pirellulales bacterium]